jgi:hypothetical protein
MTPDHRAALLLVLTCSALSGGQPLPEFDRARPALVKQLRDKSPATRGAALKALRQYPVVDAAKLALPLGADPDPDVRRAAVQTLVQLHREDRVRAWAAGGVSRDTSAHAAALAAVLLTAEADDPKLIGTVNRRVKDGAITVADLVYPVAALGGWSDPGAVRAFRRVPQLDCFATSLPLKWAVVEGLCATPHADTLPVLIDLLAQLDGEVQFHVAAHLRRVTGATHGTDAKEWRGWWESNRDGFRYPPPEVLEKARAEPADAGAGYYGIPIRARRLVFVIDTSGSMAGPRLASAKKELVRAIGGLPDTAEFNVIVFSARVAAWSPRLVRATEGAKKQAVEFVDRLVAAGGTSTYDALAAALGMRVEAIYLLTDGEPSTGLIVDKDAILVAMQNQNRGVGSSIHTIGIGLGGAADPAVKFLKKLAEQNHGQHRTVE